MSVTGIVLPSLQVQINDQLYPIVTPYSVWAHTVVQGIITIDNSFLIEKILVAPPMETVALIVLFSKRKYGINAKRIPYYLAKPLTKDLPNCKVTSTYGTKHGTLKNIYAKIKITTPVVQSEVAVGEIVKLFGTIDDCAAAHQAILHYYVTLRPKIHYLGIKPSLVPNALFAHYAYTIDPEGCRDIDDAISFDKCDNHMKIGIHITDIVSLLNKNPSYVDYYYRQPFSIYSPTKTIHSLPDELSCEEGSLVANGTTKQVISLYIELIDNHMESVYLARNEIQIKENLSYEQANDYISKQSKWLSFFEIIKELISKDTITILSQEPSHMIVDYLMVFFNRHIAEELVKCKAPNVLLRVHQDASIQTRLDPDVSLFVYRSRDSKAFYSIYNEGDPIHRHEGLALEYYTHFTSPLRRYPDYIVHLSVYQYLFNQEVTIPEMDINYINQYEKRIKKMERIWRWTSLLYSLGNEPYETTCYVVDWSCHNSLKLELFFPEWNSCLTSKLIDKQIKHHYRIQHVWKSELLVNEISIFRYQKLCVKVWWDYSQGFKGTRIQFVSPSFSF